MGPYTALPLVSRDPIKGQYNLPYSLLPVHQKQSNLPTQAGGLGANKSHDKENPAASVNIECPGRVMKYSN